ncbi:sugar phosphate isomerase/epimerase [Luteolibacter sp. GHJ8]|uniref:Sugar phosphate isomerase/epimerase n=1 Tax=Luteolibacter rhizosphaerae TaxID=2989719 RepID=A0ABT3FXS9_9BACT|nr:sugar phosphate isomerase/epimerase [Luteolibacter rhizosphaerae]MCW1912375.1 sugar phosphate isomerase/epimerase [Luteolibacter rhizosphaerae]
MKRRSLFTMVPAASALLALRSQGKTIAPEALTPAGFAISVQCWSLKEFTLWEAIEKSAAAGATAVEVFPGQKIGGDLGDAKLDPSLSDENITKLLAYAKDKGITPVNFGVTGISKDEAEARKTFEFAKKMGLYGVTTESLDALDTLEKLAKEYDIKVCFHNHPKPTSLWDPNKIWEAIKDRHANIGYCADLGHWATSGLDPLEVIKKVAPRVHSFHMKDREAIGKWTHDRPFGTGVIDNIAILDEVRKHGFAGNVTIEYEHNWKTNVPEIAQCVGYLRAYSKFKKA